MAEKGQSEPKYEAYPIGVAGEPWGEAERVEWFNQQEIKRSYADEVTAKINKLLSDKPQNFELVQYGTLEYQDKFTTKALAKDRYPLYILKSLNWNNDNPTVLVTGGVHGYETSGVQGALLFAKQHSQEYLAKANLIIAPCVSPWGYETINRWNPDAVDPNRSFIQDSPAQESRKLIEYLDLLQSSEGVQIDLHIDLHETTDTDNLEFRPALAARDAKEQKVWDIPDGFYLVGETAKPEDRFQQAIIDSVAKVTHIAPADDNGQIIGVDITQLGVINYAARKLGLCAGYTDAAYVTTTEVYPDSPKVDLDNCNLAQVAAITGAIEFVLDSSVSR